MNGRILIAVVGLLLGGWGAYWLLERPEKLPNVITWLAAPVLLHDFVVVPIVLMIGLWLARIEATRVRRWLMISLTVIGPLTLAAIPVLGRFGEKPDNPTLLDRPYWLGWLVLSALVLLAVAAIALRTGPRRSGTASRHPRTEDQPCE